MSSSKVNQDNLVFPSEVLCDLLWGRQLGVRRSEEVCVFFSFMGNTLYRKKKERWVKNGAIRLKGSPKGGLIIIPASAM